MATRKKKLDYQNKVVLAPMVRIGTLPTRLVALDYGADIVYTEEIIDLRMLQSKRVENAMLGTVDFVMDDESVTFRTCPKEKDQVVFQIGTADAQRALKVAKMIENDVAGIDLNMGCPKEYSTKGGMGAALLGTPHIVKDILTTLVNNLSIPVSCKMRILPTIEETLEFVKMLESTGVSAIAVHGRYREERPRHPCHNDLIKLISETVSTPIIANGGSKSQITKYEDIEKFRVSCGAAAVMLARAAQWDPSIFRAAGPVPLHDTCKLYVKYAIEYDSTPTNVKYNVQQILHNEMELPRGKALAAAGTMYEISQIWELEKFCEEKVKAWNEYKNLQLSHCTPKLRTLDDGTDIWEMEFRYYKREYSSNVTPKYQLDKWIRSNDMDKPIYKTVENDTRQFFYSTVTVNGVKYASTLWDKSKKAVEQAAAAVFLRKHGLPDGRKEWPGQNGNDDSQQESVSGKGKSSSAAANQHAAKSESDTHTAVAAIDADGPVSKILDGTNPTSDDSTAENGDNQNLNQNNHRSHTDIVAYNRNNDLPMREEENKSQIIRETDNVVSKCELPIKEENKTESMDTAEGLDKAINVAAAAAGGETNKKLRREALKRQGSMTELIDDIIEKQVRLSESEDSPRTIMDSSVISSFSSSELQTMVENIGEYVEKSSSSEEVEGD